MSSRLSISARTASTWSWRAIRTASSSSWTACAKWCASPRASTSRAGSTRRVSAARARVPGAFRAAPARHARGKRARRRHEHAAPGAAQAGASWSAAREALGHPIEIISGLEEARLIYLGVAHTMPQRAGPAAGGGHRRRQHRADHRRRLRAAASWRACTWAASA